MPSMLTHNLQKILFITGPDAEKFLQNQLTCDMRLIAEGKNAIAASCNLQGKVMATLRITREKERFSLLLPADTVPLLQTHFQKYILFSKATMAVLDTENDSHWREKDIEEGFPNIFPETSGLFTPHMINLQNLGGVSFKKGCYLGQEIIARSEHLGTVKRHLYRATLPGAEPLFPGDKLYNEENNQVGTVIDATLEKEANRLLAVLSDEAASQAIYAPKKMYSLQNLQALALN